MKKDLYSSTESKRVQNVHATIKLDNSVHDRNLNKSTWIPTEAGLGEIFVAEDGVAIRASLLAIPRALWRHDTVLEAVVLLPRQEFYADFLRHARDQH